MKKVFLLILLFFTISSISCRHDTSELQSTDTSSIADVNIIDVPNTDISSDNISIDIKDISADDTEDVFDVVEIEDITDISIDTEYPNDIIDIYEVPDEGVDILKDVEDINLLDSEADISTDIVQDINEITDVINDITCVNLCDLSGTKECFTDQNKEYVRECKDINNDGCLEWIYIEICTYGCKDAQCLPCKPDCTNKECGDDGCGGSCGSCNKPPDNYCDGNNLIQYDPIGSCQSDNKCKYSKKVITCQNGCENAQCLSCTPNCSNKNCGPDGCGGSCGSCNSYQYCNPNGVCTCLYVDCNGVCCESEEYICYKGVCCMPDCAGKECGPDKCGGNCGDCADPNRCINGICQPINP